MVYTEKQLEALHRAVSLLNEADDLLMDADMELQASPILVYARKGEVYSLFIWCEDKKKKTYEWRYEP
jgi:hypothetical protein